MVSWLNGWTAINTSKFVATTFLDKGIRRWGKVTSNAAEAMNSNFGDARLYPIVYLIEHLVKYQQQKYHE
jgi:hypothetical protein